MSLIQRTKKLSSSFNTREVRANRVKSPQPERRNVQKSELVARPRTAGRGGGTRRAVREGGRGDRLG